MKYKHFLAVYPGGLYQDVLVDALEFEDDASSPEDYFVPGFESVEDKGDVDIDSDYNFGVLTTE